MIKKNNPFTCLNCGNEVQPAKEGKCRNHCNFCLFSQHIDIEPGDRKHSCKGLMKPIRAELRKKGKYILHECNKCGIKKWNKIQKDDKMDNLREG
jgi:hypothetical protein